MNAYARTYVAGAQSVLGSMLQAGVSWLGLELREFYQLFLASRYAGLFARGDVSVIAGRSGCELALMVAQESGRFSACELEKAVRASAGLLLPVTPEYWTGWALSYYQWASGWTFSQIDDMVCIEDVRDMYSPYHEMDIRQFCEEMDRLCAAAQPCAPCKAARMAAGLSQSELAELSGIPVRSIQQYEQRQKSINRAGIETVLALARALCCEPASLLEHSARSEYEYACISI